MDQRKGSPYVSPRVDGQGTQSAVGLKAYDIAEGWVNEQWNKNTDIQLPFIRKSTCHTHDTWITTSLFNLVLVKLINGQSVSQICCLAADQTRCDVTFADSTEIPHIITMFEHLKVFHAPVYAHYTENIDQWSTRRTEKKVNNSFSHEKTLNFIQRETRGKETNQQFGCSSWVATRGMKTSNNVTALSTDFPKPLTTDLVPSDFSRLYEDHSCQYS